MRSRRGFALVAALWLLVALSVVGLEFGLRTHARNLAVANGLDASRATAAADAGVVDAQALLSLLAVNGMLDPWAECEEMLRDTAVIGNAKYAVTLRDANAAINLNLATENELRRLFQALRIDAGKADRLAQAILDWRDADDLHRARGAEEPDYLRAEAPVLPENRPFARVGELRHVMGMTDKVYQLIRPHVVLVGTGQVNVNAASRPVLLALPGMTEQAASVLMRRRTSGRPIRSVEELANELPTAPRAELQANITSLMARVAFETREVIVTSEGFLDGSPVRITVETLMARAGKRAVPVARTVR